MLQKEPEQAYNQSKLRFPSTRMLFKVDLGIYLPLLPIFIKYGPMFLGPIVSQEHLFMTSQGLKRAPK